VRPFDSRFIEIEDIGEVQDFTRDGLFFATCMPHYLVGMRLIVTFPFGENASAHHRFLGTVVRLGDSSPIPCLTANFDRCVNYGFLLGNACGIGSVRPWGWLGQ
jgi:hypothetical protein